MIKSPNSILSAESSRYPRLDLITFTPSSNEGVKVLVSGIDTTTALLDDIISSAARDAALEDKINREVDRWE